MSSETNNTVILTIDVEDNFTKEELAYEDDWQEYEGQVVANTQRVLDVLRDIDASATFFILGKVAERHPEVVSAIHGAGHEVASHGYAHELVNEMTPEEFEADVRRSIVVLEGIANTKVAGFRARSFSITLETAWAFGILQRLGLTYDSSCYDSEFEKIAALESQAAQGMKEFPVATKRVLGRRITLSGGIVFRLLPNSMLRRDFASPGTNETPMIYCHVWEFNKDQPKRKIGMLQKIAQSPLMYTTESKLRALASKYNLVSVQQYMASLVLES
jgi:polysaccharide deacetylase family protein (PEP-CTERM system associated)